MGLGMIPKGTPPIFLGFFHNPCSDGVEIDIGQAVDQGLAVINDHAFKPLGPEKPFPPPVPSCHHCHNRA